MDFEENRPKSENYIPIIDLISPEELAKMTKAALMESVPPQYLRRYSIQRMAALILISCKLTNFTDETRANKLLLYFINVLEFIVSLGVDEPEHQHGESARSETSLFNEDWLCQAVEQKETIKPGDSEYRAPIDYLTSEEMIEDAKDFLRKYVPMEAIKGPELQNHAKRILENHISSEYYGSEKIKRLNDYIFGIFSYIASLGKDGDQQS